MARTRRQGVPASATDGTGVANSEMVQFVLEGAGVGGNIDDGAPGATVLLIITGMTKS